MAQKTGIPGTKGISRRIALGSLLVGAAGAPAIAQTKPRTLALIGDRYHNADYIRVAMNRLYGQLDMPIDYTIDTQALSAQLLRPYQILLILRDGMLWPGGYEGPDAYCAYESKMENADDFPAPKPVYWMTQDQGLAVSDFVARGNGLFALHSASYISLKCKPFRDVMGGVSIGHAPLRPFQVRPTTNPHPITAGLGPFMVSGEQHYVDYDGDPRNLILESENIDGLTFETKTRKLGSRAIAGWAIDHGKGRVVFMTVGHNIHVLWNPVYSEIQRRTVHWLLKDI